MPRLPRRSEIHEHILAVMDEIGVEDPYEAVKLKARSLVSEYQQFLGEPPFNVKAIASIRGLHWSDDNPRFSADSEIAPEADGRVVLRVNSSRPATRQRFSICHEIGHTLFPDYELEVRCRKRIAASFADQNDLLETLCDVAASEFMFPSPWFDERVKSMRVDASQLAQLADDYEASREATMRRFVEVSEHSVAAVFFDWKLKPTEIRAVKAKDQTKPLFDDYEPALPTPKLRVNYRITNKTFDRECQLFIPEDKSIENNGPIYTASKSQTPSDGEHELDFGSVRRSFRIAALPIFTHESDLGPNGESSVVAVLSPL